MRPFNWTYLTLFIEKKISDIQEVIKQHIVDALDIIDCCSSIILDPFNGFQTSLNELVLANISNQI